MSTPALFAEVWRVAVFAALQPALGALALLLLHRMTGGQWFDALAPSLRRFAGVAPWLWLLLAVTFLPGVSASLAAPPDADASLRLWFSPLGRGLRWALTGAILAGLTFLTRPSRTARWIGPVGFIVLVFTLHLAAVDWLVATGDGWFSTGFPLIWMAGNVVTALSLGIVLTVRAGHSPAALGDSGRPAGQDWGNLLLAAVLFWSYLSFTHFLIMWMGNLPVETRWYAARATTLGKSIITLIAICHLLVPLLLLCFRRFKQSAHGLARLGGALAVLQTLHLAWLMLP